MSLKEAAYFVFIRHIHYCKAKYFENEPHNSVVSYIVGVTS